LAKRLDHRPGNVDLGADNNVPEELAENIHDLIGAQLAQWEALLLIDGNSLLLEVLKKGGEPLADAHWPGYPDHHLRTEQPQFAPYWLSDRVIAHYAERGGAIGSQDNSVFALYSDDECYA
jgi:hypothetical protein